MPNLLYCLLQHSEGIPSAPAAAAERSDIQAVQHYRPRQRSVSEGALSALEVT